MFRASGMCPCENTCGVRTSNNNGRRSSGAARTASRSSVAALAALGDIVRQARDHDPCDSCHDANLPDHKCTINKYVLYLEFVEGFLTIPNRTFLGDPDSLLVSGIARTQWENVHAFLAEKASPRVRSRGAGLLLL